MQNAVFYSPTTYLNSIKRKSLFRLNVIGDRKNVVKVVALKRSTYNTFRYFFCKERRGPKWASLGRSHANV